MVDEPRPSTPPPGQERPPDGFYEGLPRYPPSAQPATPIAKRRRPSAWWFVLTVTVFVIACGLAVVLIADFARGLTKLSHVDATVAATGTPVSVHLTPHTSFLMWDQAAYADGCTVMDQQTGAEVATSELHATSYHRTDRSGAWYGVRYVDSGSGRLQVTCDPSGGPIQFGARPVAGDVLGNTGLTVLAMVTLGTIGLAGFVVTLILFVTGAPRRTRPPPAANS